MAHYKLPDASDFNQQIAGKNTHLLILQNRRGMQVALTDYGARIVSILVPDTNGNLTDVVLGFNSLDAYVKADEQYHGATIGRYANRIANGQFTLDGKTYNLAKNNGNNSLHGGPQGFHNQVWDRQVSFKNKVDFYYVSPDGEEGFPGALKVHVSYELNEDNEIIIHYKAETTKKTIVNLTNHAYFNLNGEGHSDILHHFVQIPSANYLPIDEHAIPFGFESSVEESPFDFREAKPISEDILAEDEQLLRGNGYDHTFINTQSPSQAAAIAFSKISGIQLEVFTTEPGIQFYTGNFLSGKDTGKSGAKYSARTGFCFETQHYPDSPNQENFPSTVLDVGETYLSETRYKFSIKKVV